MKTTDNQYKYSQPQVIFDLKDKEDPWDKLVVTFQNNTSNDALALCPEGISTFVTVRQLTSDDCLRRNSHHDGYVIIRPHTSLSLEIMVKIYNQKTKFGELSKAEKDFVSKVLSYMSSSIEAK